MQITRGGAASPSLVHLVPLLVRAQALLFPRRCMLGHQAGATTCTSHADCSAAMRATGLGYSHQGYAIPHVTPHRSLSHSPRPSVHCPPLPCVPLPHTLLPGHTARHVTPCLQSTALHSPACSSHTRPFAPSVAIRHSGQSLLGTSTAVHGMHHALTSSVYPTNPLHRSAHSPCCLSPAWTAPHLPSPCCWVAFSAPQRPSCPPLWPSAAG